MTGRVVYSTKLSGEVHVPQLEEYACLALKMAAICSSPTVLADMKLTDRIDSVLNEITRTGGTVTVRTGKIKIEPASDRESAFLTLFDGDLREIKAALSAEQETGEARDARTDAAACGVHTEISSEVSIGISVKRKTESSGPEGAETLQAAEERLGAEEKREAETAAEAFSEEAMLPAAAEAETETAGEEPAEDAPCREEKESKEERRALFHEGDYYFRKPVSDHALIALLLGSVFYSRKVNILLDAPPENTEYIDLALNLISSFGGMAESSDYKSFTCSDVRKLIGGGVLTLEGDWKIASFGLMCSAIGFPVNIRGSHGSFSVQHGAEILAPLKRMGFTLEKSFDGRLRFLKSADMFPTGIDVLECAEFLPYMILISALGEEKTDIFNVTDSLPAEIADRIVYTVTELSKLGIRFSSEKENTLTVTGRRSFEGGVKLDCHNDYVLATALILATLRCRKPNTLLNLEVVEAVYPDFWRMYESIGGFSEEIG